MAQDATGTPTSIFGIPTYNTNVDAPSGNGFNAAMASIDSLLNSRTTVAALASVVLQNKVVSTDANPVFKLTGDGKLQWGAGGVSALDTALYRAAAAELKTDTSFTLLGWLKLPPGSNLDINGAAITPTGSYHGLFSSGAGTILTTINGGVAGRVLILRNTSGGTFTMDQSSNIVTKNGGIYSITSGLSVMLVFDTTNNRWSQIA